MTCELCNAESETHHVLSRGAWGESAELDDNKIQLCRKHHSECHKAGTDTFAAKYGLKRRFQEARFAVMQDSVKRTVARVR